MCRCMHMCGKKVKRFSKRDCHAALAYQNRSTDRVLGKKIYEEGFFLPQRYINPSPPCHDVQVKESLTEAILDETEL